MVVKMRIRMVTRTVTTSLVNALVANLETNTIETKTLVIGGKYTLEDEKALNKAIKAAYPDTVVVKVVNIEYGETLYGIEESEFLKIARVLPPRASKTDDEIEEI